MNPLWRILDKTTTKKMEILQVLINSAEPITIDHLAKRCHVGRRTLNKYLDLLFDDYKNYDNPHFILHRDSYSVRLFCDDYQIIYSFIVFIIENSLTIKLLLSLLLGEIVTLTECMNRYFISESTFKRRLKSIQQLLDMYHLVLKKKEGVFVIVGEERSIRMLAYHVFWNFYRGGKWPFQTIDENKTKDLLATVFGQALDHWSVSNNYEIRYVIAINLIRYRKGYEADLNYQDYFSKDFLDAPIYWAKKYQLSKNEALFFLVLIQTQTDFFLNPELAGPTIAFHKENNTKLFQASELFFEHFSKEIYPITSEEKESFYPYIFCYHIFSSFFHSIPVDINGFLHPNTTFEAYPVLAQKLTDLIHLLYTNTNYAAFINTGFLLARYTMFFSRLTDITHFEKEIIIYMDTNFPALFNKHLADRIRQYFNSYFNVKIIFNLDSFAIDEVDLLLTTSFIPTFGNKHINSLYITDSLRTDDILKIEAALTEIRKNKK